MVGQIQILDGMFKMEQMLLKTMELNGEIVILMAMVTIFLVINQITAQTIVVIRLMTAMDA